jgi:glycosyltransferase involved in cell wall biosynthesis
VSFFAENRAYHKGYAEALAAIGVEVLYHPYLDDVQRFLKAEGARFELCILSRYYVAERFLPLLRSYASKAKIWFDTVDLHFLRELREAELLSDAIRLRAAEQTKRAELALMRASDLTLVVSPVERNLLRETLPTVPVEILSNIHAVPGRRAEFAARRDLFFVGGFQHPPNTDAVLWFVREIWPLVAPHLAEAKLHIIGSKTPDEVTALASERVLIHGFVHDLVPMLDGARLSIAPLRYGAGVKGKINLSMSYGCPVVATAMAVEGMFLEPEHEVLVADTPELFAQQVVRLYQDEALWLKLSDASVANVEQHFSIRHARATLEHLLKQWC